MSKLRQHVKDMETSFYRMLQVICTHTYTHSDTLSDPCCRNGSGPENCDSPLIGPDVPPQRACTDGTVLAVWSHTPSRLPIIAVSSIFGGYFFFVLKKLFCEPFLILVWEKASLPITRIDRGRRSCLSNVLQCRKSHPRPHWTLPVTLVRVSSVSLKSYRLVWR